MRDFDDMSIDRREGKTHVGRSNALIEISDLDSEGRPQALAWRPGQKVAFIAKAEGVLMVPVPEREALAGMARGANPEGYRDRNDRF